MEYRDRAKSRKIKRQLLQLIDLVKLKGLNLSFPQKLILFWTFIGFCFLFINWVSSTSSISDDTGNSFSNLVWMTWISLLIIHMIVLFLVFSKKNKNKIKLSIDSHIKDFSLIIICWIITEIFSINALFYTQWLQQFSSDIVYGNWIIWEIAAWIMIIVWWFLLRKEFYKNINKVYINESEDDSENQIIEENNMSLPF